MCTTSKAAKGKHELCFALALPYIYMTAVTAFTTCQLQHQTRHPVATQEVKWLLSSRNTNSKDSFHCKNACQFSVPTIQVKGLPKDQDQEK